MGKAVLSIDYYGGEHEAMARVALTALRNQGASVNTAGLVIHPGADDERAVDLLQPTHPPV